MDTAYFKKIFKLNKMKSSFCGILAVLFLCENEMDQSIDFVFQILFAISNQILGLQLWNFIVIAGFFASLFFGFLLGKRHEKLAASRSSSTTSSSMNTSFSPLSSSSVSNSNSSDKKDIFLSPSKPDYLANVNFPLSPLRNRINSDDEVENMLINDKFSKNFENLEILGKGGFGVVYKVRHILEHKIYAVKVVPVEIHPGESLRNHSLLREIFAMTKLDSPHVIKYVTCWLERIENDMILFTEEDESDSDLLSCSQNSNCNDSGTYMVGLFIQIEY